MKTIISLIGVVGVFVASYYLVMDSMKNTNSSDENSGNVEWVDSLDTDEEPAEEATEQTQEVPKALIEKKELPPMNNDPAPRQDNPGQEGLQEPRPFKQAEDYPGYNLEVLEEHKIFYLVDKLGLYKKDAQEVSDRYLNILKVTNETRDNEGEKASMNTLSRMASEYDIWLKDKLGDEDFKKFNEFLAQTFAKMQITQDGGEFDE